MWVIRGSGVLCDENGLPHTFANTPKSAIKLFAPPHHWLATHAIGLTDALGLGLIYPYGQGYDSKTAKNLQFIEFGNLLSHMDETAANHLSHAISLVRWQHEHQFCGVCGNKTVFHRHEYAKICTVCKHHAYPRIQPCVIVAIVRTDTPKPQLLLARHHKHKSGIFGLIAGFMEAGETVEMAIVREVQEEIGIRIKDIRYFGSQSWPYPSNLMLGFFAHYDGGDIAIDKQELAEADFFELNQLPPTPRAGSISHQLIRAVIEQFHHH